jgi:hypothetical protein
MSYICVPIFQLGGHRFGVGVWFSYLTTNRLFLDALLVKRKAPGHFLTCDVLHVINLQFKATEPYFDDYRTFHIESAIEKRGFSFPSQTECSPRHRTIVAIKK